jgi:hypothetical protein
MHGLTIKILLVDSYSHVVFERRALIDRKESGVSKVSANIQRLLVLISLLQTDDVQTFVPDQETPTRKPSELLAATHEGTPFETPNSITAAK